MHRLIPSQYSESGIVLEALADSDEMLNDIVLLDGATNSRVQAERHGLIGISTYELVYGIPNARIVNAAFTHAHPAGSRFNDFTRGAWYASEEVETSIAEVLYHKKKHLAEMIVPELPGEIPDHAMFTYDDWLADFRSAYHALEPAENFSEFLQPEPVPVCYGASQLLARQLLGQRSNGLLYPSVRRRGFRCLVCFRPALVHNPRQGQRWAMRLEASDKGYEHDVRQLM